MSNEPINNYQPNNNSALNTPVENPIPNHTPKPSITQTFSWKLKKLKPLRSGIVVGIITIGLISATYLTQQSQDIRQQAASDSRCNNIAVSFSPTRATYQTGNSVGITVSGLSGISNAKVDLYAANTNQKFSNNDAWEVIRTGMETSQNSVSHSWTITDWLANEPAPYNRSNHQEKWVVANVWEGSNLICTGNPEPAPSFGDIECNNCRKLIALKPNITDPISVAEHLNQAPGHSFTYTGIRKVDNQTKNFQTFIEYEAPLSRCNITVTPMRMTKTNAWGYHGSRIDGSHSRFWFNGNFNLRWFVTDPTYNYPWNNHLVGAPFFKIYFPQLANDGETFVGGLPTLGSYDSTFRNYDDLNLSNQYYPPYNYNLAEVSSTGVTALSNVDAGVTEDNSCNLRERVEPDHNWHFRSQLLTNNIRNNFFENTSSFSNSHFDNKSILVTTYFEGTSGNSHHFREDWYLMEDVGVVGIDQAFYEPGSNEAQNYYNANFMLDSSNTTPPDLKMRAYTGYIGETLQTELDKQYIQPGENYTLTVTSQPSGLPYEGYLEFRDANGNIGTWSENVNGQWRPVFFRNGQHTFTESVGQETTHAIRSRRKITTKPPNHPDEAQLSYSNFPWSNEIQLTVTNNPPSAPTAPTNLSPTGTSACGLDSLVFSWDSVAEADDYLLRIDNTSNPWGPCTDPYPGDSCHTLTTTSRSRNVDPDTSYNWWVQARNEHGLSDPTYADISVPACLPPPTNLSPTGTSACGLDSLTFSWNSVAGADDYLLRINDTSNPWSSCANPNPGDSCHTLTGTSRSRNVNPDTTYNWWVHARNEHGTSDQAYASVSVPACLPPPTNLSPTGTSACGLDSLVFSWDSVAEADDYLLRIDNTSNPWGPCTDPYPGDSCHTLTTTSRSRNVDPNTSYNWWVQTRNEHGVSDPTYADISVPACLPGDLNQDGYVNITDAHNAIQNFQNPYTLFDFNQVVKNFGTTSQ